MIPLGSFWVNSRLVGTLFTLASLLRLGCVWKRRWRVTIRSPTARSLTRSDFILRWTYRLSWELSFSVLGTQTVDWDRVTRRLLRRGGLLTRRLWLVAWRWVCGCYQCSETMP